MDHALKKYRQRYRLFAREVAEVAGIDVAMVLSIERWKRWPSVHTIDALIRATKGEVKAEDFLPSARRPSRRRRI